MKTKMTTLAGAMVLLSGCATRADQPLLIFARTQNLGVNMGASVPEQGGAFTVGFSDKNFATTPVTTRKGDPIRSSQSVGSSGGTVQSSDALSVLGQFGVAANQSDRTVTLGTFFSTGTAASKLSDGFAAQMGLNRVCEYKDEKLVKCGPPPAPSAAPSQPVSAAVQTPASGGN